MTPTVLTEVIVDQTEHDRPAGCSGPCRSCWANLEATAGPSGRRMILASVGLFLGPIVLAIVGALLAGATADARTAGAVSGLLLGMAISVIVGRLIRRHEPTQVPPECPVPQGGIRGQEEDE